MNKKLLIVIAGVLIVVFTALVLMAKKKNIPGVKKISSASSLSVSSLLAQAKDAETKENLLEAKTAYQKLINEFPNSAEILNWQKKYEGLNIKLLFSSQLTPKSMLYEIKPGDNLNKIAREFKTTQELIKKSNRISDDKILPGRKIKVWITPFSIVVDKSQNLLILKSEEEIVKTYIVSTGANNSTPAGNFKIINKLPHPTWFKAGAVVPASSPENILGSRWLGFNLAGYGIHGTTSPESLGKQVTQGCVRMANSDVEELYAIVPEGTEVTIVD